MRFVLCGALLVSWLTFAQAQSRFDGTWKIDLDQSQPPTRPNVYLLQDNRYRCATCAWRIDKRAAKAG